MIGLINTDGDSGAQIFQVVTVALLLFAAFLQEGALCLLIASPLVYGVAYSVHGLTRIIQQTAGPRHHALGMIGIVALGSLAFEGTSTVLRVNPHQSVSASDVVAADCSTFERALDRGPEFADADRGWLLQTTPTRCRPRRRAPASRSATPGRWPCPPARSRPR
ncbi:hypothetical protein [Nocardioides yefusunii]|uniref:Uncharacterized protein n=1 Tax=Nocardioides yefusunii TaxID=2500546 RepID=A0ABW1QYZ2_9ACTN|nr:hypothetical protein [Nocardioides yefusunii]